MLRGLILLLLSPLTLALQPRDFRVPSVDFTKLSSAVDNADNYKLLTNLQENGIIALKNVPSYSILRQEYLRTAVSCAMKAQKQDAEFLHHRQLRDGTNRYTVSLESGHELSEALDKSQQLLELCPEYVEIHAAFSAVVELAVANVGTALDSTQKFHVVAEQGAITISARKLLEDSVHLDHFHAYEAVQGLERQEDDSKIDVADMSLELHTDNGLMIAMSAPEYFIELKNGEVHHKDTQSEDAGLFIETSSGEIVRPVVNPDELILMLGSGIDNWIKTTPPLRSVLHGMRYPRSVSLLDGDEQGNTLLRSWFGKMILLETQQVMDNTGLTFGQYANQTTRYLVQEGVENHEAFGAVACPPHRHLAASDKSCSLKMCTLKSSASESDLTSSCQITCNHASASDAALCEKYCDCEASSSSATTCWMLCVENVSSEVCPGEQVCNTASTKDELAMTCVAGTVSPSTPSTPTVLTQTGGNTNPSSPPTSAPSTSNTVSILSTSSTPSISTSSITAPALTTGTQNKPTLITAPATGAPSTATVSASSALTATDSNSLSPGTDAGTADSGTKVKNEPPAAVSTTNSSTPDDALTISGPSNLDAVLTTAGSPTPGDALTTTNPSTPDAAVKTAGSSTPNAAPTTTNPSTPDAALVANDSPSSMYSPSAPSSSPTPSTSSASSVTSIAIYVNGIASLVAAILCIQ
ncbi:unnamed protein product [Peronospora effusa]|uniref:VWFD domain-containing protein n=1 Tax=Peronospora effusa TaxID=542832 RepID=A0A3M6V6X8_9STRA|nr:hypothetical protein DD238_007533 [Peronospora effusa]RQM16195.1 hypothetical protein DD237_006789 [Peronospora effusa]CAI5708709.1 unnamed protein product [Peronospora effusa]